jgi:invasion protein IalB
MIRFFRASFSCLFAATLAVSCVASFSAQAQSPTSSKTPDKKSQSAKSHTKTAKNGDTKSEDAGKPVQTANFGDWGAYLAQQGAKKKTCYALAQPKDRDPAKLKRDPAYIFISSRPAENVHNEISIIMGFAMKDNSEAQADIGGTRFDLIAKGSNAWIKNPAEEAHFIESMKKGSKLVIKASSSKGNTTTDSYSLAGLSQALERVQKDCP